MTVWLTMGYSEPAQLAVERLGRICPRLLQPTGVFRRRSLSLEVRRETNVSRENVARVPFFKNAME